MTAIGLAMVISAILSGIIAAAKERTVSLWAVLGLLTGPIAVTIVLYLPTSKPGPPAAPVRSIAQEIDSLDEMRQRGIISDDEFAQGKAQVLAWPITSPIPPALTPQRVWADGRRTWASYQPATRAACVAFARRHKLELIWRDDVPAEVVATYPVQMRLSLEFTLALEKGEIHCWGTGWKLRGIRLYRPDTGLPGALEEALDALIEGSGRVLIRTALGAPAPFWIALQVRRDRRWRTVLRQGGIPVLPFWRCAKITNTSGGGGPKTL